MKRLFTLLSLALCFVWGNVYAQESGSATEGDTENTENTESTGNTESESDETVSYTDLFDYSVSVDTDLTDGAWTSPTYTFAEAVEGFRVTVFVGGGTYNGSPWFSLGELEVFDAEGNPISYTATTNSEHASDGGGVASLNDGDYSTYYHAAWSSSCSIDPAGAIPYLDISLSEAVEAFTFKMTWRSSSLSHQFPTSFTVSTLGVNAAYVFDASTGTLTVSGDFFTNYATADALPWYDQKDNIQKVVVKNCSGIPDSYFANYAALAEVEIKNCATIGAEAFSGCSALTTVALSNCTTIGDAAFKDCVALTQLTLTDCATIGAEAFSGCSALSEVSVSGSPATLGENAFAGISEEVVLLKNSIEDYSAWNSYFSTIHTGELIGTIKYLYNEQTGELVIEGAGELTSSNKSSLTTLCKTVVVKEGITIGDQAFMGCSNITSISIPESVTSIGEYAFYVCSSLVSITLPESVTSIGDEAFALCSSLTSITIPESVTSIGRDAFNGCSSLTSITIPEGVTSIGYAVFIGCSSLTSITLPEGVTSIGDYAFRECSSLTSITIPESVTSIGDYAFRECSSLTSITIPESVTSIGDYAFRECSSLTQVISNATVAPTLESNAFDTDTSKELIYPEGSDYIKWGKYFPKTFCVYNNGYTQWVVDDAGNAVVYCTGSSYNEYVSSYYGEKAITGTVEYLDDFYEVSNFNNNGNFSPKKIILPEGVQIIGDCNLSSLEEISLPSTLTSIGSFQYCSSLKNIYLPEGITTIPDYAFYETQIEFLVIPSSVTKVGDYVLYNYNPDTGESSCGHFVFKSLTPPTIGEFWGTAWVPEEAVGYPSDFAIYQYNSSQACCVSGNKLFIFGNTDGLGVDSEINGTTLSDIEQVIITPDAAGYGLIPQLPNVTQVDVVSCSRENDFLYTIEGSNAVFKYCDYYGDQNKQILVAGCVATVIPEGTTKIESYAFNGCTSLKEINIPNSVVSFGHDAFGGCTGLEAVHIDDLSHWCSEISFNSGSPLSQAKYLYVAGEKVTHLVIPADITKVNSYAFWGYTALESVEIPDNIQSMGYNVFSNCTGLTEAKVYNSRISSYEFTGCTSLRHLVIGQGVTAIDVSALNGCTALDSIDIDEANSIYDKREGQNGIVETAHNKLLYLCKNNQIPSTVTTIGDNAFNAHADLDVTIPASVTSIAQNAFSGVNKLFFEAETPVTITGNIFGWGAIYVPAVAFDTYCNADVWTEYKDRIVTHELADKEIEAYSTEGTSGILDAVGLNEASRVVNLKVTGEINSYDITVIRDKMPLLCTLDLSEATVIASAKPFYQTYCTGKNSLGGYAFYNLDKLLQVKLPKDLVTLGTYAFASCDKLVSVDASAAGELDIDARAFNQCPKLTEFVAPAKIGEVGTYAFSSCGSLKSLQLNHITGSIASYAFSNTLKTITVDALEGDIASNAFANCSNLESIGIDSIGGGIGSYAFANCSKLPTFQVNVIGGDIAQYAFNNCSALKEITIGSMQGALASYALANCASLQRVEMGYGPTSIGKYAFKSSNQLEKFVAGEGLTTVADYAFTEYYRKYSWYILEITRPNLKTVTLPSCVQTIGTYAFAGLTSLTDFTMPTELKSMGVSAFQGCTALDSISIPDAIASIPEKAFYGCSALKEVEFPENLVSLDSLSFGGCAVELIKLPPTLQQIGGRAFYNCSSLAELRIPSAVESIGIEAFYGCNKLNDVYTYTIEPTTITETTFSTFATAKLHVPTSSFWNYYWNIGWSLFDYLNFVEFDEPYDYFYLNNDYYLDGSQGYIDGTPDVDMRPGSGLVVDGEETETEEPQQNLGDVNVESDGEGNSASIIGNSNLYIDKLNVKINVNSGRWYFFAFPWDVPLENISMEKGSDYVFRYYDGAERAEKGSGGWKNVNDSYLKAAHGYIFQSSANDVLVISIADVHFKGEDRYNELLTHVSENLNDASWNLTGNPYLSYYDMANMDYTAPVTVWDGSNYVAIRPGDDDYQFSPYEAFFVQKPEGKDHVEFKDEHQRTKKEKDLDNAQKAAKRRVRSIDPLRLLINLTLSDGTTSDRTRVVFNDRQKETYETTCDAAKFESKGVAQIYTLDNDGVRYAINERPMGKGVVPIGYVAVNDGYYTIEAPRMDTQVFLYDAETQEIHDFKNGGYTFYSSKGTHEQRFSLGVREEQPTGVEEITANEEVEVVNGGLLVKGNADVTIYNAAGVQVAQQHGAGMVELPTGVYVISVGDKSYKMVVK